jgi:hypothetical protein
MSNARFQNISDPHSPYDQVPILVSFFVLLPFAASEI